MRKNLWALALLAAAPLLSAAAPRPASAATAAIFPAVFVNSSPEPTSPEDVLRVKTMEAALAKALAESGKYQPVDLAPIAAGVAAVRDIHDCNGCEIDLARQAGARYAVVAWAQKVSNLILNLNMRVADTETGQVVAAGSVDIRGNTEETWSRGLKFLLRNFILREPR